jgi:hypothetical protein
VVARLTNNLCFLAESLFPLYVFLYVELATLSLVRARSKLTMGDYSMNRKLLATVILPACIALLVAVQLSGVPAFGQSMFGDIRGTTRNRSGLPLPEVQVAVHSVEENTDRTVVSGADGTFAFQNLKPGRYQLTASKAGFGSSPVTNVELAAQQSFPVDMTLAAPNGPKGSTDPAAPLARTDNYQPRTRTKNHLPSGKGNCSIGSTSWSNVWLSWKQRKRRGPLRLQSRLSPRL